MYGFGSDFVLFKKITLLIINSKVRKEKTIFIFIESNSIRNIYNIK